MTRLMLHLLFLLISVCCASAQQRISVGFYNVENLFDTIPSPFYDDGEYTPEGLRRWNTERYERKLANVGQVLDEMELDVAGLAEVENEEVLRDLVTRLETDYNYVFRTAGNSGGRNLALLYKGDKFIPDRVRTLYSGTSRRFLYVAGDLCGVPVGIIVCHLPSVLNRTATRQRAFRTLHSAADSIARTDPERYLVVMGDFNASPQDKMMRRNFISPLCELLESPLAPMADRGAGTYAYDDRWIFYDNIFIDRRFAQGGFSCVDIGIFIRHYLLEDTGAGRKGYPARTFSGRKYTAGYSDHLPVYVIISKQSDRPEDLP